MNNILTKHHSFWICLVLTLTTAAVFCQVHTYDFVSPDDGDYVYENPNIQNGVTLKAIKWAFTTNRSANWHPLTWLSHMLDWQLFGPNPAGHHLTNLVFHIANTLLLFIVLKQMTHALWPSAFVASLFALHPLHVESVAWIAERKDVLSTLFWLLTMAAYLRYVKHPGVARYLLTLLTFALGLMAKPMLVTLPFVLLLLDYWPLARVPYRKAVGKIEKRKRKHADAHFRRRILYRLIQEKIPFFILSVLSGIVTLLVQRSGGAVAPLTGLAIKFRISNALISYVIYIEKMIWPSRLAIFYPHPRQNVSILGAVISAVFLLAVTILVLRFAKDRRYLFTGWFWYLGTLVPVIGLVQVGDQALSDRYSYITLTGLFIIIAWALPDRLEKWRYKKIVLTLSALLIISAMSVRTYFQLRHWRNSLTLNQHTLDVTEDNHIAHHCIAKFLRKQGQLDEAIHHYSEAVRIKPRYVNGINGLGLALYEAGRIDEAISCYKRALEINPANAEANTNLGVILVTKGSVAEVVRHYRNATEIMGTTEMHSKFGSALLKLGQFNKAVIEYRKVLLAKPNDPDVLNKLGYALAHTGKFDEAISLYNKALRIAPDLAEVRFNLGFALVNSGRLAEAVKEYEKVLLVQPQNASVHNDLGIALSQQGKFDEAITHFKQAIQNDPNYTNAKNNLNRALAEKQKLLNKNTKE